MTLNFKNEFVDGKKVSVINLNEHRSYNWITNKEISKSTIADLSLGLKMYSQYSLTMEVKLTEKPSSWNNTLKSTLFNESRSDFIFIVEGERIPVNKFVLSVRSPVFDKMFNSDFKEAKSDEHNLEFDISKETFKELIRFIYTEEINDLEIHFIKLLHASDYFEIAHLKPFLENNISEIITNENANDIFQAAHQFSCSEEFKKTAFVMIKSRFNKYNIKLPEEFIDNPEGVNNAMTALDNLVKILPIVQ